MGLGSCSSCTRSAPCPGSLWASVIGGYVFGFSSYMIGHQAAGHLNLTGVFLIPLVAEICTAVDVAAKRIVVEPPAGLLELNREREPNGR